MPEDRTLSAAPDASGGGTGPTPATPVSKAVDLPPVPTPQAPPPAPPPVPAGGRPAPPPATPVSKAVDLPPVPKLMAGKRGLIMGVANERSIAWGITQALHAAGAEMAFTYQGAAFGKRVIPMVEKLGSKRSEE